MHRRLAWKALVAGGCLLLGATHVPAATPGEVMAGGVLRNLPMQGLTGPGRMLGDYRGKPLIINVWASYCPPCLAEMGSLERLHQRLGSKIHIIGISIDDYRDRANGFLAKARTSFPHFIDQKLVLENMLGANKIPVTILVDANGRVAEKIFGAREWDSAESIKLIETAGAIVSTNFADGSIRFDKEWDERATYTY